MASLGEAITKSKDPYKCLTAGGHSTNPVGTAAPGCPAEARSAIFPLPVEGVEMRSTGRAAVVRGDAARARALAPTLMA